MVYVLPPESPQLCIGCECCGYVKSCAASNSQVSPSSFHISFWMPRSSICGFRTHPRSRKLRTSCGGIVIKKDFVSVTRRTMRASTAVPTSITKRQGGTFIRRSIWRSWRSCLRYRLRICWMTIKRLYGAAASCVGRTLFVDLMQIFPKRIILLIFRIHKITILQI